MNKIPTELINIKPDFNQIPGGVNLPYASMIDENPYAKLAYQTNGIFSPIMLIDNAVTENNCDELIAFFESHGKYAPVSVQGFNDNSFNGEVGSNRITGFNWGIADDIYRNIVHLIGDMCCDNLTSTDWWQGLSYEHQNKVDLILSTLNFDDLTDEQKIEIKKNLGETNTDDDIKKILQHSKRNSDAIYTPIGLSPMLRFMKYAKGGKHYPHYDAGFIYPNKNYRTLKSFVLYLTTNNSGATRFIKDKQVIDKMPVFMRDFSDWGIEPLESEIEMKFLPKKGSMLIFDHRLCHDVEEYLGTEGDRIIIRGDVLYKRK